MASPSLVSAGAGPGRVHVMEFIGNSVVGGMESHVAQLVEQLPKDRFDVTAVLPHWCALADRLRAAGAEVLVLAMPEDPAWASIQAACAHVRDASVDVLHAHLANAHLLAALVGRLTGRPVLATVHGRQMQLCDLEAHRAAGTHLALVCRYSYTHALGLGIDARWLHCIPNGVDTDRFRPRPRGGALRNRLGLAHDTPLVGFVGRLSPEKAPEVFLRAALLLHGLLPEAHCVVCGDGPMRGALDEFVARFGLGGQVHFAGPVPDMSEAYGDIDVVASTSHSEAMPLALMEAMACGLPVVATRVGGVPDLVAHGCTGWLHAPRDFEGIAGSLARLLRDPQERERFGASGRERVSTAFRFDACVERTGQLLSRLASPGPATGAQRQFATGAARPRDGLRP